MFAESAGKKGGDFYTPRDVIRLMVRILKPTAGMRVYDPTCGSGGMLIISREFVEQSSGDSGNLFLAGQVNDASAWSICKLIWLPRSGVGARPDAPASRESSGRRSGQDGIPTRSVGTRRELHGIILVRGTGRRGLRSNYRREECPVVDTATRRIDYAPPKPKDVPLLMTGLTAWWTGPESAQLSGPVRAGLLAHRFVTIHPFSDGNGRTARALATMELWRSGYDMRGFLSLEEHYTADLHAYYENLQMDLPVNYYDGRHDPDHTQWLTYFLATMARAAELLHRQAIELYAPQRRPAPPWESLRRVQQQLLTRLLMRGLEQGAAAMTFSPGDMVDWFGVSANTAREWLERWHGEGFVLPARAGAQRVRAYALAPEWVELLQGALFSTSVNTSNIAP